MSAQSKEIEQLFRMYYRPLCLYALNYLDNLDDAEDVVGDCFSQLWEAKHESKIVNPKAYLYALVKNNSLSLLKSKAKHDITDNVPEQIEDADFEEKAQIEARLWTAIDNLPDACRQIFIMSKRDGMKYSEIAEELNISIKTVETQISRAYKKLKEGAAKIYNFIFYSLCSLVLIALSTIHNM